MHDLHWIVFSKTGNIETYLLMKDYHMEISDENRLTEELPSDQIDQSD